MELDSNFALAVHQLSSTGWTGIPAPIDSFYRQHAIRAQRLNHGLPRRDSLLILLDSLRVVGETNPFYGTPEVPVRNAQRMLTIARQAAEDYPTDPEVLYELGEIRVHYSTVLGTKAHEARADFDRAIASDSAFAPAYEHLVSLALADQDTAGAMRYLQAMKAHAASTPVGRSATVLELGLNGRLGSRWSVAVLDSLPLEPLATALGSMFHWMDSAETATHLEQYLVAREARERPTLVPAFTTALALALSERGHLRAAYAAYAHGAQEHPRLFAEMALLGAVPADVANRTFHGWLTDDDLLRAAPPLAIRARWLSLAWRSFETMLKTSPACGVASEMPKSSTGVAGPADWMRSPRSLMSALTLP